MKDEIHILIEQRIASIRQALRNAEPGSTAALESELQAMLTAYGAVVHNARPVFIPPLDVVLQIVGDWKVAVMSHDNMSDELFDYLGMSARDENTETIEITLPSGTFIEVGYIDSDEIQFDLVDRTGKGDQHFEFWVSHENVGDLNIQMAVQNRNSGLDMDAVLAQKPVDA